MGSLGFGVRMSPEKEQIQKDMIHQSFYFLINHL